VVIAGSGDMADAKARLFDGSPAEVVRVQGDAAFDPASYAGAALAFVADDDDGFAHLAAAAARAAHIPVNVVDRPLLCDFNTPAVIDRGAVVAAVGTGGSAPLLASLLRADIEARMPPGAGWVAVLLRRTQDEVRAAFPDLAARRAFLRSVLAGPAAAAALEGDLEAAEALMRTAIAQGLERAGHVWFVPAEGPSDSLTLGAARLLSEADVLVIDDKADPGVVAMARRDAQRLEAGEAAPERLADLARQGLQVVRLCIGKTKADIAAVRAFGASAEKRA